MPRREKPKVKKEGAAWLITFSDMMTLMLTFFVLLVSMSHMDERRKLVVLGSIIGTFGMGTSGYDTRTIKDKRTTIEPGPMNDVEDMEALKNRLWDEYNRDLDFQSNKYVDIISISDRVLFKPGETKLSPAGKKIVDTMLPILLRLKFPLLLAGHSSISFDETHGNTVEALPASTNDKRLDNSWKISLFRTLSIYEYLLSRGMLPEMLRLEAFGNYRPKYDWDTPEHRRLNRRVDFVLDKRNVKYIEMLNWPREKESAKSFSYDDFKFDLTRPDTAPDKMGQ